MPKIVTVQQSKYNKNQRTINMSASQNNITTYCNKSTKLSLAVSTALLSLSSLSVFAQNAPQNDSDVINEKDEQMEVIEVSGIKGSIFSAQNLKRYADTVKDVITASDIGALPDKSVTEALQRVPGVTIERFASSDDPKHYADEGTGAIL